MERIAVTLNLGYVFKNHFKPMTVIKFPQNDKLSAKIARAFLLFRFIMQINMIKTSP